MELLVERHPEKLLQPSALAARHGVPDHWYPSEPRARARVDAALDWQHFTIRRGAAGVSEGLCTSRERTRCAAVHSLQSYR